MNRIVMVLVLVVGVVRVANAACRNEQQVIADAITASNRCPGCPTPTKPREAVEARAAYRACLDKEAAAGDPDCSYADDALKTADLDRRTKGDNAGYDRADAAAQACHARRDQRRNTPERRSITYSAAICAYLLRAQAFGRAVHAATQTGTVRGRLYAEDHAGNAPWNRAQAARLRQNASKQRTKILSCSDNRISKLALCLSYMDEKADCSAPPEADYVEDASDVVESASN